MSNPLEKAVDRAWHETKVQAAVRAERERCAKIADDAAAAETADGEGEIYIARKIAKAIRNF